MQDCVKNKQNLHDDVLLDILLVPLAGVVARPVEEYRQSAAGCSIIKTTQGQLCAGDVLHVDDDGVVGGVEGAGIHLGVLETTTVEESSGQETVDPLLVERSHGEEKIVLTERRGKILIHTLPQFISGASNNILLDGTSIFKLQQHLNIT